MLPRRSSTTARAAAAAAPMTAAAVKQLIEARVSVALANHETLRNSTNGHGDGSHNSGIRNRGTTCTPPTVLWRTKLRHFVRNALTWWNSHMKAVTQDVAYAIDCGRMFPEESDEVKKYVGGLPDMIRANVMSYRPQTMNEAIEFANDQMDQNSSLLLKGKL
ncbi:hypothetical protein Tco_0076372, partial [Tanacetum coccineum]